MPLFGRPSPHDDQRADRYAQWIRQRHPLAIASLVLGLFSLIEFGALIIFGIAGIVLGSLALAQLRRPGNEQAGQRLAWTGILLSVLSLIIAGVIYSLPRGG